MDDNDDDGADKLIKKILTRIELPFASNVLLYAILKKNLHENIVRTRRKE